MGKYLSATVVLEDWHWLHETGQLSEDQTLAERTRIAAPRIGMTVAALAKALERAGITRPVAPAMNWRKERVYDCDRCMHLSVQVQRAKSEVYVAATRLARTPTSERCKRTLAERQEELAKAEAHDEWHQAEDHSEWAA